MCGIIGIVTKNKKALSGDLISALARLEYRGYDSAGIALATDRGVYITKCVGAPSRHLSVEESSNKDILVTSIGIGHNRWATHGKPTITNAHPHTDTYKRVVVVHNGTILNYEVLKKELQSRGVVFTSETDTEVIPHLISSYLDQGMTMKDAFLKTVNRLSGAFGIVAFHIDNKDTLYVAKEGSPIVIGVTKDTHYVASSVHGFLPFTNSFLPLQDGEVAIISSTQTTPIEIIRFKENKEVPVRKPETAKQVQVADLSKGDFETFMLKEIFEQPATTKATMLGRIDERQGISILGGLVDFEKKIGSVKNILLTGCGTAYHAGLTASCVMEYLSPVTTRVEIASEGRYKTLHTHKEETIVVAISQSGETADTLEYCKELIRNGYETFGVVNVVGSALAQITGKGVYTKAGAEIGVASTKAFTSQLMALYLMALFIARHKGMNIADGISFGKTLESIPDIMKETLAVDEVTKNIAKKYKTYTKIQFLGRGIHVPIAQEASLKFKEITYLETGAYPLGELKHGPIAIVDEDTLSVVILPHDTFFELGVNSIEQIKSKGGKVLLITDTSTQDHPIIKKVEDVIFIPHLDNPLFYPFLEIIPLQLFAYHFAKLLGRDIDKPRNLAKSVTVQ